MVTEDVKKILKDLEDKRDICLKKLSANDLVESFFLMQINIFVSIFFYAITELSEDTSDLSKTYITYLKSRYNTVRYLLELYLTIIHLARLAPEETRKKIYSFRISGKITIYHMNFGLQALSYKHKMDEKHLKVIHEELEINKGSYKSFIEEFGKFSEQIPDDIDSFFDNNEVKRDFEKTFGFKFLKNNKINYTEEIKSNPTIPEMIREILIINYSLLSLEVHPTPASLIDLELFVSKSTADKAVIARKRSGAVETQLVMIGNLMSEFLDTFLSA